MYPEKKAITKDEAWREGQAVMENFYKMRVEGYLNSLPRDLLLDAFRPHDHSVRCIDEGTNGGIHLAGSGILLNTEETAEELQRTIERLKAFGVDGVYSHEGCGAAALYAETVMRDPPNAKQYGINWAKELAQKLGVEYKGHITNLSRPKEFHNARIVYYDGSGRFDPFRSIEVPDGFIISRPYLDKSESLKELEIAISIAFGHHGLGDRFNKDNPLLIIPIEGVDNKNTDLDLQSLLNEVKLVASKFGNRVLVDGFREPKE